MSYRSDVAIRVQVREPEDLFFIFDNLKDRLVKHQIDPKLLVSDSNRVQIEEGVKILTIVCYGIRWYQSFDSIHIITDWFGDLSEGIYDEDEDFEDDVFAGKIAGCQFIRIGEELDDMEEEYYGELDYPMSITREISL